MTLASLGSFGVARLIRVHPWGHWVHSGAPWASLGTFGVVGFIRGSFSSFGCALGVVGFIRDHSGAPLACLG